MYNNLIESDGEGILIMNNTGDKFQNIIIDDNYTAFYNVFNKGMNIIKDNKKLRFTIEGRFIEVFKYSLPEASI